MNHWTVRRQVYLGFGISLVLLLAVIGLSVRSIYQFQSLSANAQATMNQNLFMVERLADHLTWAHGLELALLDGARFSGQLDPTKCGLGKWLYDKDAQAGIQDPEIRRLLEEIVAPHVALHDSGGEIVRLQQNGEPERARQIFTSATVPSLERIQRVLGQIRERYRTRTAEANLALEAGASRTRTLLYISGLLVLVVAATVSYVMTNRLVGALREVVTDLSAGAEQTASASVELASSSQSLSQGASEQAASLEETSASSEEISSMARRNSENSEAAAELVAQSQQRVLDTNQSLEEMVAAMGAINASSDKISKIIKVIDEIAFQTNILALNAAVEAARAGEAGMGFAVVADEVRGLAQRCAQAAQDTSTLIAESIATSGGGKSKVDRVAVAIRSITAESTRVKQLVDEVNAGSQDQTRGIEQIGKAISQMEQITQRTAATAEESAAAAEELNAQSETLRQIVARLTAMVGGREAAAAGSARPWANRGAQRVRPLRSATGSGPATVPAAHSFARSGVAAANAIAPE